MKEAILPPSFICALYLLTNKKRMRTQRCVLNLDEPLELGLNTRKLLYERRNFYGVYYKR